MGKVQLSLATDWPKHKLELLLTGEIGRFANTPSNNYEDGTARLGGRLDVTERLHASADLSATRQHDPRGDADSAPAGTDVNVFQTYRSRLSTEYTPGDIFFGADVAAERLDYHGNGPIENDDRDSVVYAGGLRAGYRLSEETRGFVATEANARRYDQARDGQGFLQDSQGWSASLGAIYDFSGLAYLEADLVYFQQTYEDPAFDATSGIAAGLDLTWNATDLMTVTAFLDRQMVRWPEVRLRQERLRSARASVRRGLRPAAAASVGRYRRARRALLRRVDPASGAALRRSALAPDEQVAGDRCLYLAGVPATRAR